VLLSGCSKAGLIDGDEPTPDASMDSPVVTATDAAVEAGMDSPVVTAMDAALEAQVDSSRACDPSDAGVPCSCQLEPYSPAPNNDAGQPQTVVDQPEPAAEVPYHTMAEFDALAVGRWQRTAGQGELFCEQFGVEFTADHHLIPLAVANDGSVEQIVTPRETEFSISFDAAGKPLRLERPMFQTNPPIFFDGGRSMYLLYAPWPATYVRVP
jgi:hypothetical protein